MHHKAFDDIVQSLEVNHDKIALIDKAGNKHTYANFKRKITGTREHLESLGVKKGSKVLVFVTMSMELYALLEALFSLGAVTVFLDPWMKGRKMSQIIKEVNPELLVMNPKAAKYSWLLPVTWFMKKWKIKSIPENNDNWKIEDVSDHDSALITFTSGSTGNPKGANRTYTFIDAQAKALKDKLIGDLEEQNIDYTNLPIVALAGFAIGNTVVIPKLNLMKVDKADPEEIINHLKDRNVNRLVVSPSLLNKILIGIKKYGKGNIQKIVTGGAPISPQLIRDCVENHSDIFFESIYGSTEVEPISGAPMKAIYEQLSYPLKGVFVGEVDSKLKLKIIQPSRTTIDSTYFEKNELKQGEIGEIMVTGNHVNQHYFNNPEAVARFKTKDQEGNIWHRTGDIGYISNNHLYLVGRDNRIMEKDDRKIHPFPLEQFIQSEFGLTDVGYVQHASGEFILYVGSGQKGDKEQIIIQSEAVDYPIDRIVFWDKPLPRDPRHRSKLQSEELSK